MVSKGFLREVHAKSPESSCHTLWENPWGLFGVGCTVTPRHWFYWYI